MGKAGEDRERRLAEALRANLRKRKEHQPKAPVDPGAIADEQPKG
jgi:hypothetical protein